MRTLVVPRGSSGVLGDRARLEIDLSVELTSGHGVKVGADRWGHKGGPGQRTRRRRNRNPLRGGMG
eukprot:2324240-Pyramimonas_sp.AAC.1